MAKTEVKSRRKSASSKAATKKSRVSSRVRKATPKQTRRQDKAFARSHAPLPGSFKLAWQSLVFIEKFWKPLGGIVLIYTILNIIFASGLAINVSSVAGSSKVSDALNVYGTLLTSGTDSAATAQTVLLIIESLVIIWALRHLFSGEKIGVKQAYYHSMFPLVPFVIVLFVIVLQLLPVTVGSALLAIVLSATADSAAVGGIFSLLFALLAAWSIYMVSSSLFAMYIVTLPNMQPREALRSAKNLVRFRRWLLVRKILFLPLFILIIMGIILVPLILFAGFLVTPVFFLLSMLAILFAHTYLYSLYKGLLA